MTPTPSWTLGLTLAPYPCCSPLLTPGLPLEFQTPPQLQPISRLPPCYTLCNTVPKLQLYFILVSKTLVPFLSLFCS